MKKLLGLLALGIIVIVFVFSGSGKGADLLILNWGDYLSSDVIHSFEEKYGVTVKEVNVESNEQMYQNILNQSAEYDLVVPSDYMIDQMKEDGLILELDYSLLENYEENILNYVVKAEGLNEPRVLINKINLMSTLLIGKGEYYISGKSDTKYSLHNANQLYLDNNTINYIRIIEKYQKIVVNKMDETLEQTEEMIIVSKPKKEGNKALVLNKIENEKLYNLLIEKLSMNCYKDMQLETVLREKLINRKAYFEKLNVKDQAILLHNVLSRTSRGATKADLKLLQDGSAVAAITIGKNITDKNIILVQRSVTGLYEKRIRL